jgi:hypothetical protein
MHAVMTVGEKRDLDEGRSGMGDPAMVTDRDQKEQATGPQCQKVGKKRKHEQSNAEPEERPLAALVAKMQELVDAHESARRDFKRDIDDLAREILALQNF